MTRLFLDTNALVDLALDRAPGGAAMQGLVTMSRAGYCTLLTPSLALKDLSYVITETPTAKEAMPDRQERMEAAAAARELVFETCEVCDVDEMVCRRAHVNDDEPDYDDALIAECAVANGANIIVSRDRRAFKSMEIPKLSPDRALKLVRTRLR